jgi:hypothetical protein
MFNKAKFIEVSEEIYRKGLAISPNYVVGVLTNDKPIGSRKNWLLKILNAGRYSRKLLFLSIANGEIYYLPYKKEKPDYDNKWVIYPDMIINKDTLESLDLKVLDKDGVINNIYAGIGAIVTQEFADEFRKIVFPNEIGGDDGE